MNERETHKGSKRPSICDIIKVGRIHPHEPPEQAMMGSKFLRFLSCGHSYLVRRRRNEQYDALLPSIHFKTTNVLHINK